MKLRNLIFFLAISTVWMFDSVSAQTYNFAFKEELVPYQSAQGGTKYQASGREQGTFKIVFEIGGDAQKTPLFSLYHNGQEQQWFGFVDKLTNVEKEGKIFSHAKYAASSSNELVTVFTALDKSKLVIIFSDKVVEYSN